MERFAIALFQSAACRGMSRSSRAPDMFLRIVEPKALRRHHAVVDIIVGRAALSHLDTYHPMKATMLGGPCHKYRQAERAVRSTGLVTASARGAARVTGDAPRSLEAAAHSPDNSVGANICVALLSATTFSNFILIEFAAVITATISNLAGLLAKAIGRACNAGFDKTEQWLSLSQARPRARPAEGASFRPESTRHNAKRSTLAHDKQEETQACLTTETTLL